MRPREHVEHYEMTPERLMVDAIRAAFGFGPLYGKDPRLTDAERFAPRRLQSDGGRQVPRAEREP